MSASDTAQPEKTLLREQPFQILKMLIDSGGKLVSREEIQKKLWPNDTVVDFDRSINVAMAMLRRVLGDSAETPRYIETLPRRGYRLLPPVKWQQNADEAQSPGNAAGAQTPTPGPLSAQAGGLIGKKVARYRVMEVLGAGGMGMVYKAEDLKLGRRVALKFLPEELGEDPAALRRFEREAQTASALNHPNICTIYGIEEHEGKPFIVMELLEGDSLSQRIVKLHSRPFSLDTLLDVAVQICDGLQAAHGKGIIHRDIKPGNIFLTNEGPVKILDFGLAKLAAAEEGPENLVEDKLQLPQESKQQPETGQDSEDKRWDLTVTGIALGTTGYMSPEQIRKEKLDGRTDLFSFGLVLYEMATGSRAFAGDTAAIAHDAILHQTPSPARDLNPSLPRRVDAIISKAIEKDRTKRYQSAAEMRQDLLKVRKEIRPPRRALRWSLAAALVLASVAACWLYLRNRVALSPNDTIVRADFDNQTGDTAFTDGLKQALEIALDQTPYLNILSRDKVRETLASLNLPVDTKLTADIARRICKRTGSRLVVTSSIADEGNRFHIELGAIDCTTGRTLVHVANDANSRDDVVRTLGVSAVQLRAKLGEPKSSLAEFNKPLEIATSSSPDALHFLALAYKSHLANDFHSALGYYHQAIEKDPNLALAYMGEGSASVWVGDAGTAIRDRQKAFDLRDRLTAPNEFQVETNYFDAFGTGQLDEFLPIAQRWVRIFPHDVIARINLSVALHGLGRHEDALIQAREAARLLPSGQTFQRLFEYAIFAERLDEARETYKQITERKFDNPETHFYHALLAFLQEDQSAMQQEWTWAAQHPGIGGNLVYLQEKRAAYHGRSRESHHLREELIAVALKMQNPNGAGHLNASGGLLEAEVGDSVESQRLVANALKMSQDETTLLFASLASARIGNLERAQKLANDLNHRFPLEFLLQSFSLPTIDAAIKLNENDPAAAITILEPVASYDLAEANSGFDNAYPAYLRGLAYLQLKKGTLAELEFKKVLDHPAIVQGAVIGALARLQLARAQAMMGDEPAARKSYEDFLTLWKDADADSPVLKEAKAEYGRIGKPSAN
ncbi:MAG: protein kinase [Terracidiphilus sp.]